MIGFSVFVAAAFLLILLLLLLSMNEESAGRVSARSGDQTRRRRSESICPQAVTQNIFSQEDFEFILRLGSPRLLRTYREERKGVALHWIRRASREIRQILQEHAQSARLSHNLKPAAEAKLFIQYAFLRLICALLMIFIRFLRPPVLHGIATYLSKFSDQIGHVQRDFEMTTRIVTPQDSGTP